jgi:hypothetical protein
MSLVRYIPRTADPSLAGTSQLIGRLIEWGTVLLATLISPHVTLAQVFFIIGVAAAVIHVVCILSAAKPPWTPVTLGLAVAFIGLGLLFVF